MIPLTVSIDPREEHMVARGGFPERDVAMITHREIQFETVALLPGTGIAVRWTGTALTCQVDYDAHPDRALVEQACRELAEYLGWTVAG